MKKITLIGCALFLVGAASCNKNENSFTSTSTFKVETYSLVTGSDVEPSVSLNNYTFVTDNYNFKMMMMSNDLNIGGSVKSFSTKEIPMIMGRIRMQGCKNLSQFCLGEAADASQEGGTNITNVFADFTTCSNTFNDSIINLLAAQIKLNPIQYPSTRIYCETQFKLGDYQVRTFWKDMIFTGNTSVGGTGMSAPIETKTPSIRVMMNLEKAGDYKADVFLYNVSYLNADNTYNYVLKGVPVKFGALGYTLECSDVTPEAILEKDGAKAPAIKVDKLIMNSSSPDLTQATCRIMLDNGYVVSFQGMCLIGFNMSDVKQ